MSGPLWAYPAGKHAWLVAPETSLHAVESDIKFLRFCLISAVTNANDVQVPKKTLLRRSCTLPRRLYHFKTSIAKILLVPVMLW